MPGQNDFRRPSVAVAKGTNADSADALLRTALDGLGGIGRFIKPGQTVAIKPNATWAYPPNTASSTDPDLLRALILMAWNAGAGRIIVLDHCTLDPGSAECLRISGIGAVLDELGVEKVFPDRYLAPRDMYQEIDLPKGRGFRKLGVIKAAVEADVRINMAVAKSHLVTKLTMCLKHMMGFLEVPNALHAQLEQGIADINTPSPMNAHLHILEALRVRLPVGPFRQAGGQETDITHPEKVKRLNQIIAGTDPVLIDAYGCQNFFSFEPAELAHLLRAHESGIGEIDVGQAMDEGRLRLFQAEHSRSFAAQPPRSKVTPDFVTPPYGGIVDSRPFLRWALIPAAAVVLGVGIILKRLLNQKKEPDGGKSRE